MTAVMIYRFDKDFNGEVFAESKRGDLEPFLGLHYPHTDIPVQARALFIKNPVRLLADAAYVPVPIYALQEHGHEPVNIDLSMSAFRSFSPIHIQYLKNMGVAGTLNIAILHKGSLWGLISCHHYSPKIIPYYLRLAAQLQGAFLSSQIEVRQVADDFEFNKITDTKINKLQTRLSGVEADLYDNDNLALLKELLNANGIVLMYNGQLYMLGDLPGKNTMQELLKWLSTNSDKGMLVTDQLSTIYPEAVKYSELVSGVTYLKLDKNHDKSILWTISEEERFVNWGGNPEKAVIKDNTTMSLSPRNSFALWKQKVKNKSRGWKQAEIQAAQIICSGIQQQLHVNDLKAEEKRYLDLNDKLKKANEELSNMNWISSHDLKEPLRKIQIYASMILENQHGEIPETVKSMISRMQASAGKMQTLIEDLLSYSTVIADEQRFINIDLNEILDEVFVEEKDKLDEIGGQLAIHEMPVVKGIHVHQLHLFLNLVRNSIKFAKPRCTTSY